MTSLIFYIVHVGIKSNSGAAHVYAQWSYLRNDPVCEGSQSVV